MQCLSDKLFARARFAADQHRRGGICDGIDQLAYLAHRRAVANDGIRLSHQISVLGGSLSVLCAISGY